MWKKKSKEEKFTSRVGTLLVAGIFVFVGGIVATSGSAGAGIMLMGVGAVLVIVAVFLTIMIMVASYSS